jgi:hypothetical protein
MASGPLCKPGRGGAQAEARFYGSCYQLYMPVPADRLEEAPFSDGFTA